MPQIPFRESKLFQILELLSPEEYSQLEHWLTGLHSGPHREMLQLIQLLLPYYPNFRMLELEKKQVYRAIFPEGPIRLQRLTSVMSLLVVQIEQFLAHRQLDKVSLQREYLLIKAYQNRGKLDWAVKKAEKLIQTLQKNKRKDQEEWQLMFELHEQVYRLQTTQRNRAGYMGIDTLTAADQYLDQSYAAAKYRFLLEFAEWEEIQEKGDYDLESKIKALQDMPIKLADPAHQLYRLYLINRQQAEQSTFQELKSAYLEHSGQMNKLDRSILLFFLLNKGARIYRRGKLEILGELLELYKIGLKNDLLWHYQNITANTFANIVTLGNLAGDFDFVENFIDQCSWRLPNDIHDDAVCWARSHLAFNSKDSRLWKIAVGLQQITTIKNTFAVRAKLLSIQMWFEDYMQGIEENEDFMLGICGAFSRQLKRSKLYSPERLAALRNFVQYSLDLIHLRSGRYYNMLSVAKKEETLINEPNLNGKRWLLAQIKLMKAELGE